MRIRPAVALIATIGLASAGLVAVSPMAHATLASDTAGVTLSTDGFGVAIADSVVEWDGNRYVTTSGRTQGNGSIPAYFGSKTGANAYFLSHGGFVKKTGGTCSPNGTYYQLSRLTLSGLPAGTKDVWAFWDGRIGTGNGDGTPQWQNASSVLTTASGAVSSSTTVVLAADANLDTHAGGIGPGLMVTGTGIPAGVYVTATNGSTHSVTLSAPVTLTSGASLTFARVTTTSLLSAATDLTTLCDGTTPFVSSPSSSSTGVFELGRQGGQGTDPNPAAGLKVAGLTGSTVSFDVYVPTMKPGIADNAQTSQWKFTSLGIVVDTGTLGNHLSTEDFGIQTQIYARSWFEEGGTTSLLQACSGSPAPDDAPCIAGSAADNGVFQPDGTTRIGTSSVQLSERDMGREVNGQPVLAGVSYGMQLGLTGGASADGGYEVPSGSIVKLKLSLPTVLNVGGIHPSIDFEKATGQTSLKVDPADTHDAYGLATSGGRTTYTVVGVARSTSTAVSKQTWSDACTVSISGSSVTTQGCQADANSMVVDTVPVTFNLGWQNDPVMQSVGGGFVSTNGQAMTIGDETMTGTSFQFAVAGPSVKEDGSNRDTDGFFYICVPETFISGSFGTTVANAVNTWQGTRDGAVLSNAVSFGSHSCGRSAVGGLVASYPNYHYSSPLFSVRPPAALGGSSSGGTSATPSATPSPSASASASTTPVVVPVVAPVAAPVVLPARPSALRPSQVSQLTTAMMQSLSRTDVAALRPSVVAALRPSQVSALPPAAFSGLAPTQAAVLSPIQVSAIPARSLARIPSAALASLPAASAHAIPAATLLAVPARTATRMLVALRGKLTPAQESALRRAAGR